MTRAAHTLHKGDHIHVEPHDVYGHHSAFDEWVTLTIDAIIHGTIAVIAGVTDDGHWFSTSYLALQPVELAEAA